VEGDYGAPLTEEETQIIEGHLNEILPYLTPASQKRIQDSGFFNFDVRQKSFETDLMEDEACVFMGRDELGITFCGIEKSYNDKKIDFKKPISCHLYPIRITKNEKTGFEALNYDTWDICNPACSHGEKNKIRVFEFVKDALVRKYGLAFYDELSAAADHLNNS
jgi:hypothetical protein